MNSWKVKDIMTRQVVTVRAETSLAEAATLLQQHHIGGLPVVDAEGHLLGIVTETDLFLKEKGIPFSYAKIPSLLGQLVAKETLTHLAERARQVPVCEVMTREVITADEEMTLEDLAMLMLQKDLTRLPVVTGEKKLVGIISRVDVIRAIYTASAKR